LPTGGGRSVGIVRSRTKATEFSLVYIKWFVEDIKIRRLEWAGHIIRMEEERIPKKVLNGNFKYHKTSGKTKN